VGREYIMVELREEQLSAISKMKNGCILCGGVGSGKSRTALAYYILRVCNGGLNINGFGQYTQMKNPLDLYIITTAKKRDSTEWIKECQPFMLNSNPDTSNGNIKLVIDSWNNIKKYRDVENAFFIFDEQRVVGYGAWTKAFLKIAKNNKWILLSATPGDTWSDYIPVFIANGFYKNKTEFNTRHVIFSRYTKYPKVDRYLDQQLLMRHRKEILITMKDKRETHRNKIYVPVSYNIGTYKMAMRDRWDPYKSEPIKNAGDLCYLMRQIVNSDPSRIDAVHDILAEHPKAIIFYNFDYELMMLRDYCSDEGLDYGEWNGHIHDELPEGDRWVYLVQYSAGCEGWNCITTDTIIFYSQSYSYRQTEQAAGRIDRMNTPFKELYYYSLRSTATIDMAIHRSLSNKKNFNQSAFVISMT
jgi:hypothetical protein